MKTRLVKDGQPEKTIQPAGDPTGIVNHEGHFFPIFIQDETHDGYSAINTDNLLAYMKSTNDALKKAIELYEKCKNIVPNEHSSDTYVKYYTGLLENINKHLQTLLDDYTQATTLCEAVFTMLNIALDESDTIESEGGYDLYTEDDPTGKN